MLKIIGIIEIVFIVILAIFLAVLFNFFIIANDLAYFLNSKEMIFINVFFYFMLILCTLLMCAGGFYLIAIHELKKNVSEMKRCVFEIKGSLAEKQELPEC